MAPRSEWLKYRKETSLSPRTPDSQEPSRITSTEVNNLLEFEKRFYEMVSCQGEDADVIVLGIGEADVGSRLNFIRPLTGKALEMLTKKGRRGKGWTRSTTEGQFCPSVVVKVELDSGTVIVFPPGNGGFAKVSFRSVHLITSLSFKCLKDSCAFDGMVQSEYTISMNSVGEKGHRPG